MFGISRFLTGNSSALLVMTLAISSIMIMSSHQGVLVNAETAAAAAAAEDKHDDGAKQIGRGRFDRWDQQGFVAFGRPWVWNSAPETIFINTLRFRPVQYEGLRFQFLYTYFPTFRSSWDSDVLFRRRWDSEPRFRRTWFNNYPW